MISVPTSKMTHEWPAGWRMIQFMVNPALTVGRREMFGSEGRAGYLVTRGSLIWFPAPPVQLKCPGAGYWTPDSFQKCFEWWIDPEVHLPCGLCSAIHAAHPTIHHCSLWEEHTLKKLDQKTKSSTVHEQTSRASPSYWYSFKCCGGLFLLHVLYV